MLKLFRVIKVAPTSNWLGSNGCFTSMLKCLKIAGGVPPKRGRVRYLYLLWACSVFVLSVIYLPVGIITSLVKNFATFTPRDIFDVLQGVLNTCGGTVSAIILLLLWNLDETKSIFDQLDKHLQTDRDRQKIKKTVKRCNYFVIGYVCIDIGYTLSVSLANILSGRPAWLIYNPIFNFRDSFGHLLLHVLIEYYLVFFMALIIITVDTYPLIIIIILRAHAAVLKEHIRKLRTDEDKTEHKNYEDLVSCIKYHKLMLEVCHLLKTIAERTFLIRFLLIGIELGIGLTNILYFSNTYNGVAAIVLFVAQLVETFPFCYNCDYLSSDFEELSNLLGQSNWIGAEIKYKNTLRIFLHQLQQPKIFNAGGIFPISMITNFQVAKFAFSVLTLVERTQLVDRLK